MGGCLSNNCGHTDKGGGSAAPKTHVKASRVVKLDKESRAAAAATAAVASAEDLKARARRRALQALVESLQRGEPVIPTSKWRGQYLKTNAIGPAVIATIVNYIHGKSGATAAEISAEADASKTKLGPGKHSISTLDLRALRTGDDGFVEMMTTLLDDTLVENVIFAGNEITDDGVHRIMKRIASRNASTVAAMSSTESSMKMVLPCQLKFIGLTDNLITSRGIAELSSIAPLFRSLEQLEVGRGQSGGGEDVDDVRDTLSMDDVKTISTYIQRTPSLMTFLYKGTGNYYARSGFTPDGLASFASTVIAHSALQELYLLDCFSTKPAMIGPLTVQAPRGKAKVAASLPAAEEPNESWSPEHILKSVRCLSNALCAPSSQLSTLVLRFPLSDEAVQALTKGLSRAPHLSKLSLRGCDMSGKALGYIGDALVSNRALRMLDVSYQSNTIAHPAYLAEMRSSSKRRSCHTGSTTSAHSAAEMARLELNGGGSELPSREERQHPLLHIIRSLHKNRSLAQLVMLGVNTSTEDIEELCACIECSGNTTLSEVWYTTAGNDALKMKLEDFLAANREFSGGGNGGVGVSAISSAHSSTVRISGSCANFFPDSTSQSDRSESVSRVPLERTPMLRHSTDSILYNPAPAPLSVSHRPPRSDIAHSVANPSGSISAAQHPSTLLGSKTPTVKLVPVTATANGNSHSVRSTVSPSQLMISVDGDTGKSATSRLSRTLRLSNSDISFGGPPSSERMDDARTLPYASQMPSARNARHI
ncbi:hypothetical protein ABL78_3434 [Leptomonas seymouri]|uniref:Uncharacterized protein n=1 Tax=Leptomonas seymouri TaxID=5684 RepID=A0A0N1I7T2_LEPSE|nr:hypothetical protein ABL78_3434 [Leptomonas seymouri]|eukprot:KPI87485.1 hypothetical protein ABL78_3434 [Leptomonas seymouri]